MVGLGLEDGPGVRHTDIGVDDSSRTPSGIWGLDSLQQTLVHRNLVADVLSDISLADTLSDTAASCYFQNCEQSH